MHILSKQAPLLAAIALATASSFSQAQMLEEVVVTAQKRAESLQDVPISVTAIQGDKLQSAGIPNMSAMADNVPNLFISDAAVNTNIFMRGMGSGNNQAFEQSVGIYVDGVHYGKSRQTRTGLFDLQQVEVLRGPQGILFGKNTLAGAINVTSGTPTVGDEFSGKMSVNKESNGGQTVEGNISGSLSDTFAVRFAYKDHQDDGFTNNSLMSGATFVGEPTPGAVQSTFPSTDESMWRLSAVWEPNDSTSVELKHAQSDHVRVGGTGVVQTFSPLANIANSNALMYGTMGAVYPALAAAVAAGVQDGYRDAISFGGCDLAATLGRSHKVCDDGGEMPEGTDTSTQDTSLKIEMELANGYTLSSVTGMNKYEYEDGMDADWLPVRFIGRSDISDYDHTSQEFRIQSPVEDKFSFVTGIYIDDQEQLINRLVTVDGTFGIPGTMPYILGVPGLDTFLFFPPATAAFFGLPFGLEGVTKFQSVGRISSWQQETESWAVFFQGKYNLTDSLRVTVGLRYTEENKDVETSQFLSDDNTGLSTP